MNRTEFCPVRPVNDANTSRPGAPSAYVRFLTR
jgi:hypothetical protein